MALSWLRGVAAVEFMRIDRSGELRCRMSLVWISGMPSCSQRREFRKGDGLGL